MKNVRPFEILSDLNNHWRDVDMRCLQDLNLSNIRSKIKDVLLGFAEVKGLSRVNDQEWTKTLRWSKLFHRRTNISNCEQYSADVDFLLQPIITVGVILPECGCDMEATLLSRGPG